MLDEDYLQYRIRSIAYLGERLDAPACPSSSPPAGTPSTSTPRRSCRTSRPGQYPGQALACELYLEGGIRACEIGSVMFGRDDPGTGEFQPARLELVRLAIPRRVYTQSHIDYVVECVGEVFARRDAIRGVRIAWEPPILRHFTARFEPLG